MVITYFESIGHFDWSLLGLDGFRIIADDNGPTFPLLDDLSLPQPWTHTHLVPMNIQLEREREEQQNANIKFCPIFPFLHTLVTVADLSVCFCLKRSVGVRAGVADSDLLILSMMLMGEGGFGMEEGGGTAKLLMSS